MSREEVTQILKQTRRIPYGNIVVLLAALVLFLLTVTTWLNPTFGLSSWFSVSMVTWLFCWYKGPTAAIALRRAITWWLKVAEQTVLGRKLVISGGRHPLKIMKLFDQVHDETAIVWYLGGWFTRRGHLVGSLDRLKDWSVKLVKFDIERGDLLVQLRDNKDNKPLFTDFALAIQYLEEVHELDEHCWSTNQRIMQERNALQDRMEQLLQPGRQLEPELAIR